MGRRTVFVLLVTVLATSAVGTALAARTSNGAGTVGWGRRTSAPAPAASEASSARITSAQTIRTVWRVGTFKQFDIGAPGVTAGDSYVFAGPLYDQTDTERIGFMSGNCVLAAPHFHGLATCTVTATPHLEAPSPAFGDQITLQGWNDDTPYPFKQAITGGTGIYQNVRGDVLAEPGDPFRITFRLLP